ncbi:MAG: hypothetical protein KAQ75_17725 [Bacteroidales bacterium]|nr:hypothetical protein [Bacteroidales bacterium]
MEKSIIVKPLAYIVTFGGAIVIAGWILEIEVLKSILPMWVTMKFITALSFFLSGIVLFFVTSSLENRSDFTQIILAISTLIILFLMTTLLISSLSNTRSGIEDLFIREYGDAVKTTKPGRPSIGTMINFIFVAIAGILTLFDIKNLNRKISIIGLIIVVIGSIAVLGYVLSIPFLYYTLEGYSTAMALHTAILFIITGTGFFVAGKNKKRFAE